MWIILTAVLSLGAILFLKSPKAVASWIQGAAEFVVSWYVGLLLFAVVWGFLLLVVMMNFPSPNILVPMAFIEAVVLAFLLWLRALEADVEVEAQALGLRGWEYREFRERQMERARERAESSRRWGVLMIIAVLAIASHQWWLPYAKEAARNVPFLQAYIGTGAVTREWAAERRQEVVPQEAKAEALEEEKDRIKELHRQRIRQNLNRKTPELSAEEKERYLGLPQK